MNYFVFPGIKGKYTPNLKVVISKEQVLNTIYQHFKITHKELISPNRKRELVFARHVTCYFLLSYTKLYKVQIGSLLHRDHTTVINSLRVLQDLMDTEKEVRKEVDIIREKVFEV